MKIQTPILFFFLLCSNYIEARYPTPRWIEVCKLSNATKWCKNKTLSLSTFLKINGFDILYM